MTEGEEEHLEKKLHTDPENAMNTYHGSCHCRRILFSVKAVIESVTKCNCSICRKKGVLHYRVSPQNFTLLTDPNSVGEYQFGTFIARHCFCPVCGIHVFSHPRAAPHLYAINVNCLDDFNMAASKPTIHHFDGENWETAFVDFQMAAKEQNKRHE